MAESSVSVVSLLSYMSVFSVYGFAGYSLKQMGDSMKSKEDKLPMELSMMGKYEGNFFTLWIFMLQIVFVSVAILDELSKLLSLPSGLQKLFAKSRAYIFSSLVFPCSTLVVFTFWSIWAVDRELIFPKALDTFFPAWLNHVLHTFIAVPLLIEILLPKKDNFIKFKSAAPVLLFYAGVYQTLYFWIYLRDGVWLYPIYKVLSLPQMFIFNVIQVLLILGFQYLGLSLQNSKMKKTEVGRKKAK